MAFLVELDTQRRHTIAHRSFLGRGLDADIRLDDPLVAARHAEIVGDGAGGWLVRDLGSRRGTFLGSRKIEEAVLRDGDELLIGPTRLRFELTTPSSGDAELDRLRAVARLGQAIGAEHDLERILDRVLATCLELRAADRAAIVVYEPGSSVPRRTVYRTRSGDEQTFSLSTCVLGHVMETRAPFLGTMVDGDGPGAALQRSQSMIAQGVRSVMVVPILYRAETDEWLGVLHVDSRAEDKAFLPRDLDFLGAIAGQGGFAIKNALLVEQLKAARTREWARLERIVGDLPVGVIALDERGCCVLANRWVVARQAELGAMPLGLPVERIAGVDCDRLLAGGRPIQVEIGAPPRTLHLAAQGSPDGEERIIVVSDITDELERTTKASHDDRLAIIGQLAGGVAHDFNNLLMVIGSYAGLLVDELAEPLRDDAVQIGVAAKQATDLTRQLLTFSRRESILPEVIDVAAAVGRMEKLFGRMLGPPIELAMSVAADAPHILADPSQFEQVLMNLLLNARDAMPGGGRVALTVAGVELDERAARRRGLAPGRFLAVEVADTGGGIPADVLPRVFDPYFTTKPRGKGTGLGLAIVHGIVRQAGGDITVESTRGAGTRFRILVPETLAAPAAADGVATARRDAPRTVLVVDDEEQVCRVVQRLLSRTGYDVLVASSGAQALALLASHPGRIDLVLSDLVMPGMSGRELLLELAKTRPALPVLLMSGYHEELLHSDIRCLTKPFDVKALYQAVADLLGQPPRAPAS